LQDGPHTKLLHHEGLFPWPIGSTRKRIRIGDHRGTVEPPLGTVIRTKLWDDRPRAGPRDGAKNQTSILVDLFQKRGVGRGKGNVRKEEGNLKPCRTTGRRGVKSTVG